MMVSKTRPSLNTAQFFSQIATVVAEKGQVDARSMQEGLAQLGGAADVAQLKGLLASNVAGQLDPAARTALRNFVQQAQLGHVPDEAAVRGFSLQLQSKLQAAKAKVGTLDVETQQAFSAVGALVDKAGPAELKRALKELADAEAAATQALAAAAAAEKAAGLVLTPAVGGPALDMHVAAAKENLSAAARAIEDARSTVTALVTSAMAGRPVAKPVLLEALETLQSAMSSTASYVASADYAAARI